IIMAHLLDENSPKNVESVAARYLHMPAWKHLMEDHFKAINDALRRGTSIPYPPLEDLVKYAALDADIELRLYQTLWPKLDKSLKRLQDRKSTRLNSSHVKISYAVFCLKKKKK